MTEGPLLLMWGLLGMIAGAVAGSFLSTLALRWPRERSIARGRSQCDGCGHALRPMELLPLLSFLWQRGRCRQCHARIDPLHPLLELAGAMIGAMALIAAPGVAGLAGALFGWLLLTLAVLDVEHFWLPDRLTLPLLGLGIGFGALDISPPLEDRLIGAVVGFASLMLIAIIYRWLRGRQGLGGGDPKLLAAIGAWLGWMALPWVVLLAGLIGLCSVGARRLLGRPIRATDRLPLGALMAVAAWPLWLLSAAGN